MTLVRVDFHVLNAVVADPEIGHEHRQHDQVGKDDSGHTDTGSYTQFLDDFDVNYQQCNEPDAVAYQCRHAGDIEAPESQPGSKQALPGFQHMQGDCVDHLYTVADTYRQDQKGHQDGVGIESEAQQLQQPQLPDNGNDRADQRRDGGAQAAGVDKQQDKGDDQCNDGKQQDGADTFQQVTDDLGEADDVHTDIVVFVTLAHQRFQRSGKLQVIKALPGGGVHVVNGYLDDGGFEVIGHHAADNTGAHQVDTQLPQARLGAVVFRWDDRASLEALLGHHVPAYIRTPQAQHAVLVDTRHIEDFIGDLAKRGQVLIVENIAFFNRHRDFEAGAAGLQVTQVAIHFLDKGVALGNQLGKARLGF